MSHTAGIECSAFFEVLVGVNIFEARSFYVITSIQYGQLDYYYKHLFHINNPKLISLTGDQTLGRDLYRILIYNTSQTIPQTYCL
jgi:hypothetical protein